MFLEKTSEEPIQSVSYTVDDALTKTAISGEENVFKLSLEDSQLQFRLIDPSYKKLDTLLLLDDFLKSRKNTLEIIIYLEYDGQLVDGVDVSAIYKPQVIFGSDSLHVEDFEILGENKLIILTYPKKLEKGSRLVYLVDNEVIYEFDIPAAIISLELSRDYRGNTYLNTKENIYHVMINGRGFSLNKVDQQYFNNYIQPVHDTLDDHVYMSNYSEWYPAFEYYGVSVKDTNFQEITKIEDALMMELYRAEYKWVDIRTKLWAWDMESETGIDREVWVGANYFTRSLFYEPLYAPIFLKTDSVVVFDFYKDSIFIYDGDTYNQLLSVPVNFHYLPKKTGWKKAMIQDPISSSIYNVYNDAGYFFLKEIKLPAAEEQRKLPLNYRYCEKIDIYNGYVYYTYRPFESIQKKFLYREKLEDCKPR